MNVDLATNMVDGKRVMPRVCELADMLKDGPVQSRRIIGKMYSGCVNPTGALRLTAMLARRAGIPISGKNGRPRGALKGGISPGSTYWLG